MNINLPPVTQALILINVVVYLLEMLVGGGSFTNVIYWFGLSPLGSPIGPGFQIWQPITYAFLHAGLGHLFFNMFAVFMFGAQIEQLFGARWYATYYVVCILSAAATQLLVSAFFGGSLAPVIGASGVMLIFLPIPMPAWVFVMGYGVLELFFGVTGYAPGIAHFAHLGGMIGGFFMILHRRNWRL